MRACVRARVCVCGRAHAQKCFCVPASAQVCVRLRKGNAILFNAGGLANRQSLSSYFINGPTVSKFVTVSLRLEVRNILNFRLRLENYLSKKDTGIKKLRCFPTKNGAQYPRDRGELSPRRAESTQRQLHVFMALLRVSRLRVSADQLST